MNKKGLIDRYSKELTLIREGDGYWDGPNYIEGEKVECEIEVAPFYLSPEDLERYEGGSYTAQDLKVYQDEDSEPQIEMEDEIKYQDKTFVADQLENKQAHSDFTIWICSKKTIEGDNDD